ncbi:MAG: Na+/H+ antiporter NhaA [Gammaproteobacteria bacterium]|nr:Na+/H+ antiporter NhaA [Gammaproteobacteria bacterium]
MNQKPPAYRRNTVTEYFAKFLALESAGGLLLIAAAALAMIIANSPLAHHYEHILHLEIQIRVGTLDINQGLSHWINDGLMVIFFFVVGLELKRERYEGQLQDFSNVIFPAIAAVGGMVVPALVYVVFNNGDPMAMRGWAIPTATDIAFALGVLSLLGKRVPPSLKIFLTTLAIFDDVGAIIIIALFYSTELNMQALSVVGGCMAVLGLLNWRGIESRSVYAAVGLVMWVAMLKSGIHATLAGIIAAFFIPMYSKSNPRHSPVKGLEHDLHSTVAFLVLPVFAFANSGIHLQGMSADQLLHSVPVGVTLGLFLGKQLGVFSVSWLAIKAGICKLPRGMTYSSLYGTAVLTGIGFTMSLFVGNLAFAGQEKLFDERLGIIVGSVLSGVVGYVWLAIVLRGREFAKAV